MPENTNKVIQLKDSEGNDVSPVVNVGSIYDKNGQKVDNLLSYTIAGTDVPVPELEDVKTQIQNELNGTMDAATLGGSTKEEIVASVPAPDLSNVDAAQLGGQPPSYYASTASVASLSALKVVLIKDYGTISSSPSDDISSLIPNNAFLLCYRIIGTGLYTSSRVSIGNYFIISGTTINGVAVLRFLGNVNNKPSWGDMGNSSSTIIAQDNLSGSLEIAGATASVQLYAICIG